MPRITHVLFDFFGTLVDYDQRECEQAYAQSYQWLLEAGYAADYVDFVQKWDGIFEEFHRRAQLDLVEYSMDEVCRVFLAQTLGRSPERAMVVGYRDTYLSEWNRGIRYHQQLPRLLTDLSAHYVLGLVTNTCHAPLVRGHVRAMGIEDLFATVVTSVEHGKRKPSPCIFERALQRSSGRAERALYVGDSYDADYQGARGAGLACLLIDPRQSSLAPADHRIAGIMDLRARLLS